MVESVTDVVPCRSSNERRNIMATNREIYKSDELLARAFDWHCDTHDCALCEYYAVKQKHNSRSHCFLAWQKDEANLVLSLEPCRFCRTEALMVYGNAVISCPKCGYEVRGTRSYCKTATLNDIMKKMVDLWNRFQKGS
jgi:ribosomal protein L37AE/L43A